MAQNGQVMSNMEFVNINSIHAQTNSSNDWVPKTIKEIENAYSKSWKNRLSRVWRRIRTCGDNDNDELEILKRDVILDEHLLPVVDLCARLQTSPNLGLLQCQAEGRLKRYGRNIIRQPPAAPKWQKFLKTIFRKFSVLLWAGAVISFLSYGIELATKDKPTNNNLYLGIILVVVCLASGSFQFYQETRVQSLLDNFKRLVPTYTRVRRDGHVFRIAAEDIVIGDVIELSLGDKVPADLRIIASDGLKIDNSMLTGESEPQLCQTECTSRDPWETANLAFFPAMTTEGNGRGIVIRTGSNTCMGKIGHLAERIERRESHLSSELIRFIWSMTTISIVLAVAMFITSLCLKQNWLNAILILIGLLVAMTPEGILVTVLISLSVTAEKMAKNNCIVKNLDSVETLGSTTTICCDKTGTLTENHMFVSHVWCNGTITSMAPLRMDCNVPNFDITNPCNMALVMVAALCNRAEFQFGQDAIRVLKKQAVGSPTDIALLKFSELVLGDIQRIRMRNKMIFEIPFNSEHKYQLSIHQNENCSESYFTLMIKGAPEKVISFCQKIFLNGETLDLTREHTKAFEKACYALGSLGERVLGFCDYALPPHQYPPTYDFNASPRTLPLNGFRFLGLMSMIDPPRAAVPEAVARCRRAGIKVIMITGDHAVTAQAVAKSVGIISLSSEIMANGSASFTKYMATRRCSTLPKACVIQGDQLKIMKSESLDSIIRNFEEIVFARTTPQQKLVIVESCQRTGAVVAVTGDGVNDSPALKQSDIGVAMGITGSEVTKEAADMILLDDNFVSIVYGIEQGRLILENLKRSVAYTLTSNIPELVPFLLYVICSIPLPLGTIAVLCIDLGTDLWPAVSLAYETPEGDIMKPMTKDAYKLFNAKLLSFTCGMVGVIQTLASIFVYFVVYAENGFRPSVLFGLRHMWDSMGANVQDSYGQEWTYSERKALEHTGYTACFVAIVIVQWADLIITKNRRQSIVTRPINHYMSAALIFETSLAAFLCYCPGLDSIFNTRGLKFTWWLPALPFAVFIFVLDEIRRYIIRRFPGGIIDRETYY